MAASIATTTTRSTDSSPAHKFNLYGWEPNPNLSDDENYMDIVFLITRSSSNHGQQGHMGALVVRPSSSSSSSDDNNNNNDQKEHSSRIFRGILGAATNLPLFGDKYCTSDIHAEISALGEACKSSHSTEGCSIYITIPPCNRCFAALVAFGISRIVTRQISPLKVRETAAQHGIETVNFDRDTNRRQMERINHLVNKDRTDEELMEIAERNRTQRQQRKLAKKKNDGGPK